jgi:hypothetical protein
VPGPDGLVLKENTKVPSPFEMAICPALKGVESWVSSGYVVSKLMLVFNTSQESTEHAQHWLGLGSGPWSGGAWYHVDAGGIGV